MAWRRRGRKASRKYYTKTFKRAWKLYYKKGRKFNPKKRKRGMQKLTKSRWRRNNPVGDTLFVKAHITQRSDLQAGINVNETNYIPVILPDYINNRIPRLNDPYGVMGRFVSTDAGRSINNTSTQSAAIFYRRFRVRGVACTVTVTPRLMQQPILTGVTSQSRRFVVAAWCNSEPVGLGISDSQPYNFSNVIPEQRWVRWRNMQQGFIYGGKPTKLKFYFSTEKVFGPDRVVKGDLDFTGATDSLGQGGFASAAASRPLIGPGLLIVIYALDGGNMPLDMIFQVQLDWTWYIKYFQKHQNTVAVTDFPLAAI